MKNAIIRTFQKYYHLMRLPYGKALQRTAEDLKIVQTRVYDIVNGKQ